jgi:hypothetical protein
LDAKGRVAPKGNTVKNDGCVGPTAVTFITTPVASAGTLQLPLAPMTVIVWVSWAPRGAAREPTVSGAGRVSITRQGVIGTNTARSPELIVAEAIPKPPAPNETATAAPIAAQRARYVDVVRLSSLVMMTLLNETM